MRPIMQPKEKQSLVGIYTFRFNNKVYQCHVKDSPSFYRLDVLARPANREWELIATIPMLEMAKGSPDWPIWREGLRKSVAKHFKLT